MGQSNWVHLEVERIVAETDAAFLLRLGCGDEVWIPKSQIAEPDRYRKGMVNATISVTEWIADQKGIEVD